MVCQAVLGNGIFHIVWLQCEPCLPVRIDFGSRPDAHCFFISRMMPHFHPGVVQTQQTRCDACSASAECMPVDYRNAHFVIAQRNTRLECLRRLGITSRIVMRKSHAVATVKLVPAKRQTLALERSDCIDKKYKFNESTGENLPMIEVPVWEKSNLTLEEAAAYSGIGINKLRKLSDTETCPFVLWIGSKRLIKRRKLDEYTDRMYSL